MIEKDSEKYKIRLDDELENYKATREQRRKEYRELKAKIDAEREARRIERENERKSYDAIREARRIAEEAESKEKFEKMAAEKNAWSKSNHSYSDIAKQRVEAEREAWLAKENEMREERRRTIEKLQAKLASGQELTPMEKFELNNCLSQEKLDAKKIKKEAKIDSKKAKEPTKEKEYKRKKEKKVKRDKKKSKDQDELEDLTDDIIDNLDWIMDDDE